MICKSYVDFEYQYNHRQSKGVFDISTEGSGLIGKKIGIYQNLQKNNESRENPRFWSGLGLKHVKIKSKPSLTFEVNYY